jgi:hypothetical protein
MLQDPNRRKPMSEHFERIAERLKEGDEETKKLLKSMGERERGPVIAAYRKLYSEEPEV